MKRTYILAIAALAGLSWMLPASAAAQTYSIEHTRSLIFPGSGTDLSHLLTIQAPALSGSPTLTLPGATLTFPLTNAAGVLTNPGSGILTWSTLGISNITPGGNNTFLTTNNSGAVGWNALSVDGVTLTGDGSSAPLAIKSTYVGQASITTLGTITTGTWNGTVIDLAHGGTNANLAASNGGIFYSTASAGAILGGTATANQILMSGASTTPAWSTATYPATTTINQLLYSSADNTVTGLPTAINGVLVTTSGGVPSISSTLPGSLIIPAPTINGAGAIGGSTTINTSGAIATTGGLTTSGGTANVNTAGSNPVNIGSGGTYTGTISIGDSATGNVSTTNIKGNVNFGGPVTFPAGSVSSSSFGLAKNDIFIGDATSATADTAMVTQDVTLLNTSTHVAQATVNGSHAATFAVANAMTVGGDATFNGAGTGLTVTNASTLSGAVTATNAGNNIAGAFNGTVGAGTPHTGAFTTLSSNGGLTASGGTATINNAGANAVNIGSGGTYTGTISIGDSATGNVSTTNIKGNVTFGGPVTLPAGSISAASIGLANQNIFVGNASADASAVPPIANSVLITDATAPIGTPKWATTLPSGLTLPAAIINGAGSIGGSTTINTSGSITGGAGSFTSLSSSSGLTASGGTAAINTSGSNPVNIGSGGTYTGTISIGDSATGNVSTTNIKGNVNFGGPVTFPAGSVSSSSFGLAKNDIFIGDATSATADTAMVTQDVTLQNTSTHVAQATVNGSHATTFAVANAMTVGGDATFNGAGTGLTVTNASTLSGAVTATNASNNIAGAFNGTVGAGTPSTGVFTALTASGNTSLDASPSSGGTVTIGNTAGPSTTTINGALNITGTVTYTNSPSLPLAKNDIFIGDATSATADTAMVTQDVTLQNTSTHVAQATVNGSHATTFAVANAMTVGGDATFNGAGTGLTVTNASTLSGAVTATNASNNIAGAFNGTVGAGTPSTGVFTALTASGNTSLDASPSSGGTVTIGNTAGPSTTTINGTVSFPGTVTFTTAPSIPLTTNDLFVGVAGIAAPLATANGGVLATNSSGVPSITSTPTLGKVGPTGTTGALTIDNSANAFTTTIQGNTAATASATYTLPPAAPTAAGYMLTSTTSGGLSWTPPATGTITGALTTNGAVYASGASAISSTAQMTAGQLLIGTGAISAPALGSITTTGSGITATYTGGNIQLANTGVTSVGLVLPSIFTVTVSPITTTGSLTATLATQAANTVFAGPMTGAAAAPTFRALSAADIAGAGVEYGPASTQNTLAAGATKLFDVAYAAASGANATDAGAAITANASGATNGTATGLSITATGSGTGTATGLSVTTSGGAANPQIVLSGGSTAGVVTSALPDVYYEETGDTYGTSRLHLQNRNGSNGALFEMIPNAGNPGVNLCDFGFKPGSGLQSNLRLEARKSTLRGTGDTSATIPEEFQMYFGTTTTPEYVFEVGEAATLLEVGNFGIGYAASSGTFPVAQPLEKLDVHGSASTASNIMLSNTGTSSVTGLAGTLKFQGTNDGLSTLAAGAQGSKYINYTLPTVASAPTANQVLAISSISGSGTSVSPYAAALTWSNSGGEVFKAKSADVVLTASNTTLQIDPDLQLSLVANATYEFSGVVAYDASGTGGTTAADLKIAMNFTGTATSIRWSADQSGTAVSPSSINAIATAITGFHVDPVTAGNTQSIFVSGIIVVGVTPGTLEMEEAQNTSQTATTTIRANSFIRATRVQ